MPDFAHPLAWLLAVPALLALAWSARERRRRLEPGRVVGRTEQALAAGATLLRLAFILALVAAAAGLRRPGAGADRTLVFLVDRSGSLDAAAQAELAGTRRELVAALPPRTNVGEVAFAAEAVLGGALRPAAELRAAAAEGGEAGYDLDRDGTNPAAALRLGAGLIESAGAGGGRLVLQTDGRCVPTALAAAALDAARAARARNLTLEVLPAGGGEPFDLRLAAFRASPRVAPGAPIALEALVVATRDARAELQLRRLGDAAGGAEAAPRLRQLQLRANAPLAVRFTDRAEAPGARLYEARIIPADEQTDRLPQNDALRSATLVAGGERVLLVAPETSRLAARLAEWTAGRLALERLNDPAALPAAGALRGYAAVVLDDLAADRLAATPQAALASYVRDAGGGLLVVGGPHSFAAGGWTEREPLAAALPVRMLPRDARQLFVVFVLDCSGSMGLSGGPAGSKLNYAREATIGALAGLGPDDLAAVVGFSDDAWTLVEPSPPHDEAAFIRGLQAAQPQMGTDIRAGLAAGYRLLGRANAQVKGLLLLSDGVPRVPLSDLEAYRNETLQLAAERRAAQEYLWVVGLGGEQEMDRKFLEALAGRGGTPQVYVAGDAPELARRFHDIIQLAASRLTDTRDFTPRATAEEHPALAGLGFGGLTLRGRNRVALREGAELLLDSGEPQDPDPVLALWTCGLGRSAALLTAPDGDWGAELVETWGGRKRFWLQLLGWLERRGDAPGFRTRIIEGSGPDGAPQRLIELEAVEPVPGAPPGAPIDERGRSGLAPVALVGGGAGAAERLPLVEEGLGRYRAPLPLRRQADGAEAPFYFVDVELPGTAGAAEAVEGGRVGRLVWAAPYPAEYARLGSGAAELDFLKRLAEAGGGRVWLPGEAPKLAASERAQGRASGARSLRLELGLLALGLYLAELGLRAFGSRLGRRIRLRAAGGARAL